jgi:predicted RecB family nuclease
MRGNEVGILARQLYPGGTEVSPENPENFFAAAAKTREFIDRGADVLYEAAFLHEKTFCVTDILVRDGDAWRACEVKSAAGISPEHIMDAAMQYHVITEAGVVLKGMSLIHINRRYQRHGEVTVPSLFSERSVWEQVLGKQETVQRVLREQREVLERRTVPEAGIGVHCIAPVSCDFRGYCWGEIPEGTVFDVVHMPKSRMVELYRSGIESMGDIPEGAGLNAAQRLQVECFRSGKSFVDRGKLGAFLDTLDYPLYFLDFESATPAVPPFDGLRPYQHVPFQYSLHYLPEKGTEPEHMEFLGTGEDDFRREFIATLLAHTEKAGHILVYDRSFEEGRLRDLGQVFPEYGGAIKERLGRMRDLMEPFRNRYYYSPAMKGRYSIKSVLPALVPELSYRSLTIRDGYAAMNAYEQLRHEHNAGTREEIIRNLKEYCRMDTLAMVKILRHLEKVVEKR